MALIWFDAHGDLNTPDSSPSGHFHGMPLRTLLGEGDPQILNNCFSLLNPNQLFMIGARDLDAAERDFIDQHNIATFGPQTDPSQVVQAVQKAGFQNVYLHFDLDVLSPEEFTNMIFQVDDGLPIQTALQLVNQLSNHFRVVGSSLLEYVGDQAAQHEEFLQQLAGKLTNLT